MVAPLDEKLIQFGWQEVERLLEDADCLPIIFADSYLAEVLIVGVNCLRKALSILPEPHNFKRCKLKDVETILDEIQVNSFFWLCLLT